ncbi:thiamin-phosphate pyrophosphorylase [Sulfuriferula multivorans]|uniref:Thiamine-phosphate synthase n=1 Tax=Sulfuriferula multivorans TaxID=1559896 RepID=A0A401J9D0_9PROT|nr:thiamine phosphate synthase [Sulfuriferula multivorans]GBL44243.1 thiamin-phosphate pyrophosphorylase [Sulfuriferula multivorans]
MIGGLYAITRETDDSARLLNEVEAALRGGAAVVQYRDKSGDVARQHEQASELLVICKRYRAPLIINDSLRLADLVGADGVHLGRDDGGIREARIVLGPEKIIGVSCYQSLDLALAAQAAGADYVAFGSFFASTTKPAAPRADIALLQHASHMMHLPIVAIGGIAPDNAESLIEAGADAIAVIHALFEAADIEARARCFADFFIAETED